MKKEIKYSILGFIIGIPAILAVFLIGTPVFIFLALGTTNASESVTFLVNCLALIPFLTPFLGAYLGWKIGKKKGLAVTPH